MHNCEDHSSLHFVPAEYLLFIPTGSSVGFLSEFVLCFSLFQPKESDAALFEPKYYYGFTAFRSQPWESLDLGCDDNKLDATLVKMKDVNYPNPQALFTVYKWQLDF